MRLELDFRFEAAHWLPRVPAGHKCGRVHGHSYAVTIAVVGEIDPALGWVVDFGLLRELFAPFCESLDHRCLNDVPGLANPTAEVLAMWLHQSAERVLHAAGLAVEVADVTVSESGRARVVHAA